MTAADGEVPGSPGSAGGAAEGQPSEEEVRARLEEEVRNLRVQDLLLQSVVSVINLAARRIGKEDERDLDQARVGIDAVRAVVDLLDPEPAQQVRQALSEVQVMYANASGGEAPEAAAEPGATEPAQPPPQEPASPKPERPSGLWTPPGT